MTTPIRDATANDLPLIMSAWGQGYRKTLRKGEMLPGFKLVFAEMAACLLKTSSVRIAEGTASADQARGFAVWESVPEVNRTYLHWLYVKRDYQGYGIAKALVADMQVRTGRTDVTVTALRNSKRMHDQLRKLGWGQAVLMPWLRTVDELRPRRDQ